MCLVYTKTWALVTFIPVYGTSLIRHTDIDIQGLECYRYTCTCTRAVNSRDYGMKQEELTAMSTYTGVNWKICNESCFCGKACMEWAFC